MKAAKSDIDRALAAPASVRFFLFHGPDEAGSRALARRVAAALGPNAERIDLTGTELRGDPARLADEAAAISLFGGARAILVDPAGDEALAAVEALAEAPVAGNPVAIVAGALRPTSKLLKLAVAQPDALAFASYPPEGRAAGQLAMELGRAEGLSMRPEVAQRIADGAGADRALIAREIEKLACYADAAPDRPREIDHDAVDEIGAARDEGDLGRLVDAAVGGDAARLEAELLRLSGEGVVGISLLRAMLRRMTLLARLRAEVDAGKPVGAVMASQGKAIFWKDKDKVAGQLGRWRSDVIAKAVSRLVEAERQVMAPGGPGPIAAGEELFAICRQAARFR